MGQTGAASGNASRTAGGIALMVIGLIFVCVGGLPGDNRCGVILTSSHAGTKASRPGSNLGNTSCGRPRALPPLGWAPPTELCRRRERGCP